MLIDTHCHLGLEQFQSDLEAVIGRACEAGVRTMVVIGIDLATSARGVALAEAHSGLYASVGIHPNEACQVSPEGLARLRDLAQSEQVVAIGETGLDYYRNRSPRDTQVAAFRAHIKLAQRLHLPLVIHNREAHQDIMTILQEEQASQVGGVLHCFSGTEVMAKTAWTMGFYLSIAGQITYPKASLFALVKGFPREALLLETDAPFIAPVPKRGRRSEPAFLVHSAHKLAQALDLSYQEVADLTTRHARALFRI